MSSGKCKLKQDTTMYLLEWPQSRTLTTPRMWSNRNSLSLLVRTQHNTATSQDSSSQSSNCVLCYILRGVENLSSCTRMVTVGLFITEKQPRPQAQKYRQPKSHQTHRHIKTHYWTLHCTPERRDPDPPTRTLMQASLSRKP